jgi:4-hydroxybenzoate polyprenyltransferase
LGLAIAAGPGGAWIAVTGGLSAPALWLMVAVTTWIGGFDILYSLSDREFDRKSRLSSIPARFGITAALAISAVLHIATVAALAGLATAAHLGPIYLFGVAVIAAILVWEHAILRPTDLSRLDMAFFSLNGYVSVAFLAFTAADLWF